MPLVMETGLTEFLSTDPSEGPLAVPLRRVDPGTSSTVIRRVLLLVYTQWSGGGGFREEEHRHGQRHPTRGIRRGEPRLREEIDDSPSRPREGHSQLVVMDTPVPFTRGEVQAGGRIVLSILGGDAWKPMVLLNSGWTRQPASEPGSIAGLAAGLGATVDEHGQKRRRSSVDLTVTPG